MKKSCLFFDKKIQMCLFHSPLQRSYLKLLLLIISQNLNQTNFIKLHDIVFVFPGTKQPMKIDQTQNI